MTNAELEEIKARQQDACPEGRVKFISEIIEKDALKLIREVERLRKVLGEIRDYIETDYPMLSRAKEMAQNALHGS